MKGLALVLVLVVSVLLFVGNAKQVAACSCTYTSVEEAVDRSDAVFSGRVMFVTRGVDIDSVYQNQNLVGFWVSEVWKGPVRGFVYVRTSNSGAGCGSTFKTGREYLVYAWDSSFGYSTGLCSGTKDISPGSYDSAVPEVDLEFLGEGQVPPAWDETPSDTIRPIETAAWGIALVMAGFILAVGSILGHKRLRNR